MSDWLIITAGLAILTVGADVLIRGASTLARRFGVSELLIGLTLVGFGTSTPELVSSIQAAVAGSPGVALGNVIGSNIANILLILGISAAIAPFAVDQKAFKRDGAMVLGATIVVIAVSMTGEFSRIAGVAFLAAISAYIAYAFLTERSAPDSAASQLHAAEAAELPVGPKSLVLDILLVLAGLAALVGGAKLLVGGAISVAANLGVSETVIGLTVVAIGTSLPELVTSVVAAVRGKSAMALGNVIGSNIYNSLFILGATSMVQPVAAPIQILQFDNWVMLGATIALVLFARTKGAMSRLEGMMLVGGYGAYLLWTVANA